MTKPSDKFVIKTKWSFILLLFFSCSTAYSYTIDSIASPSGLSTVCSIEGSDIKSYFIVKDSLDRLQEKIDSHTGPEDEKYQRLVSRAKQREETLKGLLKGLIDFGIGQTFAATATIFLDENIQININKLKEKLDENLELPLANISPSSFDEDLEVFNVLKGTVSVDFSTAAICPHLNESNDLEAAVKAAFDKILGKGQ